MPTRDAIQTQANEIATRLAHGERVDTLAHEYGISRMTVWRRNNQGIAQDLPGMDDRDETRTELTTLLWKQIIEADERNDRKALVPLLDRFARMNGLDHSHRVQEAQLQLDAARVRLISEAMTSALEAADIPVPQRRRVLELIAGAGQ